MADTNIHTGTVPEAGAPAALDWDALARTLNAGSAEEAQRRAWEIASFIGSVDNDANSQLLLRRGDKQVPIKLRK